MEKIFIDLEMNPTKSRRLGSGILFKQEIIEIGAVKLNEQNEEIESFQEYVKPGFEKEICPFISGLTGIRTEDIADARDFRSVMELFIDWCGEDYEIYAWSDNDLMQLRAEMKARHLPYTIRLSYMVEHWKNFQKEYGAFFGSSRAMSLKNAVILGGLAFDGTPHRALVDARNTANIYRESQDSVSFLRMRKELKKAAEPCVVSLGDLFDFSAFAS